jgi:DNA repair exonuclease SbcCD ATPase subunit
MNKINKIRISDFRIYHGVEEFDFTKNDSTANLVAIYAPNGYGKTSFFDAVEWAYSDKIIRLESNAILKDSLKESDFSLQDKIVLTNRKSYQEGKLGIVEVHTEEKTLIKKVTKRKRNGIDIADDYRAGTSNNSFKKCELEMLAGTNLLSQDQIDSFLRYKSPEEKFKELKVFWPQGEEAVTEYDYLSDTESALTDKLRSIAKDIDKAAKKIDEIGNSEEAITKVNQSIEILTTDENSSFSPDLLTDDFTKKEYETLLKSIILATNEVKNNIENQDKVESKLAGLSTENGAYSRNVIALEKLEKEINLINHKKKLNTDLDSLKTKKIELENFAFEFEKKQSDFKILQEDKVKFSDDKENIEKRLTEINVLKSQSNNIRVKNSINQSWLNKLDASKKQINSTLSTKKDEYKQYAINKKNHFNLQTQVKPTNDELTKLNLSQKLNGLDVNSAQEVLRNLTSIINGNEWSNDFLNQYTELKPEISRLINSTSSIEQLKELLKSKESEFKDNNSLNDSLEKIKGWGENYVESTNVKKCPLCTTEFKTFDELIKKIKSQKSNVLKIEELQKSIKNHNENLQEAVTRRKEVEDRLRVLVNKLISDTSKELDNHFILRDKLQNKKFTLEKRKNELETEITLTSDFFRKYIESGSELDEENISKFERVLLNDISLLEKSITRITRIIEKREIKKNSFNKAVSITKDKIHTNEYEIELLKVTLCYQVMRGLIEKYRLQDLTEETLKKVFLSNDKENSFKQTELSETNIEIKRVNDQLLNCGCEYKILEIEGILIEFSVKEKELSNAINIYKNLYKEFVSNDDVSLKSIELQNEAISKTKLSLELTLNKFESFQADIEIIENAIEKSLLEKDIANLEHKIPALKSAKVKIIKTKESCIEYIQEGINNYFNKEVINQIYKRIEPHPSLTEVNFKAEVGSHGPRLLITAKGLTDEVNPNLFLSAGQVNVLSLSIFLAKAFEYGSDTISTIFMDDPVQNLSDINILSFIDLLRTLTTEHNKQIVLSTHEEKFYRLLQNKLPSEYCNSKYLEFESEGKLLKESEDLTVDA